MRRIDGGRKREDPDVRAARWFRLIASTMKHGADDLDDTPHHAPLMRQASRLELYASELATEPARARLRVV